MKKMSKEVQDLITEISESHSGKVFGYFDRSDIKSEIWIICLNAMEAYDSSMGPLENWLRVVVKNRLTNQYRKITKSVKSPCPRCPFYIPGFIEGDCAKFREEKQLCSKWEKYQISISSRNNLLNATEEQKERYTDNSLLDTSVNKELIDIIKSNLSKDFLYDFGIFISGGKIPKLKLKKLRFKILEVLTNIDYFDEEELNKINWILKQEQIEKDNAKDEEDLDEEE